MWLGFFALVLVIAAVVASAFAGGVFTIVLIPLAVLAVIAAALTAMWGRASEVSAGRTKGDTSEPAPSTRPNALPRRRGGGGHPTATPDQLIDARQEQQ